MDENHNEHGMVAAPSFRVWLCGAFRVERRCGDTYEAVRTPEWGGSSYPRLLLKALLCCVGRQARRDVLIELLWPEADPEQAAQYLNTATTKLRKVLEPAKGQASLLLTEDDCKLYRLQEQSMLWTDTEAALLLLKRAETLGRSSAQALPLLEEAVMYLSRGTFLEEEDGLWLYGRRQDLKEASYNARRWLAEAYLEQNMIGQAEIQWRALLSDDPADEDVLCQAIAHLHHHGLAHKAARLYQQIVEQLAREGLELTAETEAFVRGISHESALAIQDHLAPRHSAFQAPFLFSGGTEPLSIFSPIVQAPLLPAPIGSISLGLHDPASWFGGKLASVLTLVEDSWNASAGCLVLQEQIGKELHAMHPNTEDEGYARSRRQVLITLATLPTALLLIMLHGRRTSGQVEHLLTRCAASLAACWHLMRGSEYAVVEEVLPTYLPLLTNLAQESSKHQRLAASLATQGYRLKGILALHRNDAIARDAAFQQAVLYAQIAQNPGLLAAALISLAYHQLDPAEAERLYQQALTYQQAISPLQRSRLYAELAVACAQQDRLEEASRYLAQAQQDYPTAPEDDPSFLYAEFSPASLLMEQGRVHLALAQHRPEGTASQQAWETFAGVEAHPTTLIVSERIRYEIVNYQAETALALRDRDLCCTYVERGAQGALLLGSVKRRKEVVAVRNRALKLWPHDGRVKELRHLFA
jgi:DNA-binding SARP family transcriptional activator/tetratricopeptide (TPR) repeat protein